MSLIWHQSPQFYKEHGVAGFERVFETYHVYRPEPQATSRHLTKFYSLDIDFGFIDGPEYVIQLERELLTYIFNPFESAITRGGQRLRRRERPDQALRGRGIDPDNFERHLKMFDLGMPAHGGFAIGLERLTAQVLNLSNVRQAVLYPRDSYKLTP